ncbi:hypothetical protein KJ564_08060 [bacterium]|nr:hypothetical protein [bacterium]
MYSKYPLIDLTSDLIAPFQIGDGISIIENDIRIEDLEKLFLSAYDEQVVKRPRFCVQIDETIIEPQKASVLFIVSCRLLKRTKVSILRRVDSAGKVIHIKDDYPDFPSDFTTRIDSEEFKRISELYSGLLEFSEINNRSKTASFYLSMAYRVRNAINALLFHVITLETITSGSMRENENTRKFVDRINHFIGYDKGELKKIYHARSGIVHGRFNPDKENDTIDFDMISEEVSRKVFNKILTDRKILDSFINDDSRMKLFE